MPSVAVVVPVYREAESIAAFHQALAQQLDALGTRYDASIVYVMDPSDDGTLERLRELAAGDARVSVLVMSARFGHQMALVAGIDHVDADACITMDADLQHPPAVLPELLQRFEEGADVVLTERRDRAVSSSRVKRATSRVFYRLLNAVSDVEVQAGGADFRLLSRRVVEVLQRDVRERNVFLRGIVPKLGFHRVAVPYDVGERYAGTSKYSFSRSLRLAADGILSSSKKPLTASIAVGVACALFGFLFAVASVISFAFDGDLPSGYTTIVTLVSILAGAQLVFLGVLGLYIGAIFDEVKARPRYILDEVVPGRGLRTPV